VARRSQGSPAAAVVGVLLVIGLVLVVVKWLLITAAILAVPFGLWWVWDRTQQQRGRRELDAVAARRREVESRAVLDAAGGCGWCGMATGHRDHRTGARVTPRAYHHHEVEQALAALPAGYSP
jgi:ABC-type nickel/cobalt efflux system permease component RcnA